MEQDKIEGTLTTQQQFIEEANKWGAVVAAKMRTNAMQFKYGKGKKRAYTVKKTNRRTGASKETQAFEKVLKNSITHKIRTDKYGDFNRVSFSFPLHGIFRAHGVGSGQPASDSSKKRAQNIRIRRTMSDWINQPIAQDFSKLADIAANYYGDKIIANVWGVNFRKTSKK